MVRPRSAKPLFPGSNPGGTSKNPECKSIRDFFIIHFTFYSINLALGILFFYAPLFFNKLSVRYLGKRVDPNKGQKRIVFVLYLCYNISKECDSMNFRFNVTITDQDYLDYNTFWMLRSPYGKKQMKIFRIVITVFWVIASLVTLFMDGFSIVSVFGLIPLVIVFFLIQILFPIFFSWALKLQIKILKKSGKMGYSPESMIEFYEDYLVEATSDNKTELKYSAVERISIVDHKMIYIHVNNVMSYILPISCFESREQYDSFLEFIKTKCANIDIY